METLGQIKDYFKMESGIFLIYGIFQMELKTLPANFAVHVWTTKENVHFVNAEMELLNFHFKMPIFISKQIIFVQICIFKNPNLYCFVVITLNSKILGLS